MNFTLTKKNNDGYHLSRDTNFGHNEHLKRNEFIKFKNNSAYLLLILMKKLEDNFPTEDFFNSSGFEKIQALYHQDFSTASNKQKYNSLEDFKKNLLDSFIFNYTPYRVDTSSIVSHMDVIDNFILSHEDFEYKNLETIHNILLFSNQLDVNHCIQLTHILTSSQSVKNDYYEFFSIKILDIIVNKFSLEESSSDIKECLSEILEYVEKNKTASQLLFTFTKIYLSLALYYSHESSHQNIDKAKNMYSSFVDINGYDCLENEYKHIGHIILSNFGKTHIKELNISKEDYEYDDFKVIGNSQFHSFQQYKELQLKYTINQEISNLTSQILNENNFDSEDINKKISHFISNSLFYGIASVHIKGLTKTAPNIEDTGYKQYTLTIIEKYEILFIFSCVYEETFKYILQKNSEYLKQNLTNILTGYDKNNILYIDTITHLQNIKKLENDISHTLHDITLVEIAIPSLVYVNTKYGYGTGNKFFRAIGQKFESFINPKDTIYRLSGARIGILLYDQDSYDQLIKKIFNFNITLKGEQIEANYTVAVTRGKHEDLLTKSYRHIEEAINNKESVNIKT